MKNRPIKYVFIVGAPRSGTTWLQLLLAQHPDIETTQETHLFNAYLNQWETFWEYHSTTPRGIGFAQQKYGPPIFILAAGCRSWSVVC